MVPKVDILHMSYGGCGGQEGGAVDKIVPKTFARCEEPSCQFIMELEDEISAKRVLQNHMFMAQKRQEQIHKQEMCGKKRGRRRVASNQEIEKTSKNKNKLIKRLNMTTLGHRMWPEESDTFLSQVCQKRLCKFKSWM